MQIGVPNQSGPAERRVAITPDVTTRLAKQDFSVVVESGAGMAAGFPDPLFEEAGAAIADARVAWGAELVVCLSGPTDDQIGFLRRGGILLGLLEPLDKPQRMEALASAGVTALAFETLPRTTRAQPMDVLSSQATAAGYQAVLVAATEQGKFFPMLTTAAGTIRPTKALVLGAGVAGLQAIATAKRLGAIVSAYDVRAAAAEQVESLGARFVHLEIEQQDETKTGGYARELEADAQQRLLMQLGEHVARHDVVISTAAIPGQRAPMLITRDMVEHMAPGSVIVDLAATTGGNCELSKADETVTHNGVTILAPTDLVSGVATHASQMYARNAAAVLVHLLQEDGVVIDFEDEITAGLCITHEGRLVNERVKSMLEGGSG
ncbi:MAG: Re/Si-specific NAD(P)(+) transhydrogenase subunit alpha [Acidimicrobiia bacterium]|nr:Re/Si-specific NAD(P)(+) transhydrogenase subunit alpha [Acidimicrobiia bacterium]MDH3396561.1 Re/Si-specific NAD(P)(+) transhydrogenase subunit alpha [Acidimicrobiia bacterium]